MQRGQIYKHRGSWFVRYYDIDVNGRSRRATKLAPIGKDYPTKRSVVPLADRILAPINAGQLQPESAMTVSEFIENYYLPHVKTELRPATHKDYTDIFDVHVKKRMSGIRLRDCRTVHIQRLLRDITGLKHNSLQRVKSFLSGTFKHAKREGFLDGVNPVQDTSVPGHVEKFRGGMYSMSEILQICVMLSNVDMTAFVAVAVAGLTGLRVGEIRGLRWGDYDGLNLRVSRSIWRTHVNMPKTVASKSAVPVLPLLKTILDNHRALIRCGDNDYIFSGTRRPNAPLNLMNVARRVIVPALKKNEGRENEPPILWKGWHAFRRSLSSNLHSLGVSPKVIQSIMRHSDVSTTLEFYVQVPDAEVRDAMKKLESLYTAPG